jgi:hypothetical protein
VHGPKEVKATFSFIGASVTRALKRRAPKSIDMSTNTVKKIACIGAGYVGG